MTSPSRCNRHAIVMLLLVTPTTGVHASRALAQAPMTALPASDERTDPRVDHSAALSYTGRFVAFESDASLVADDTNETTDVYLLDRETLDLTLVSRASHGGAADGPSRHPTISDDGAAVAFESRARNLAGDSVSPHVYLYERPTATLRLVSADGAGRPAAGDHGSPQVSADGRFVVFHSNAVESSWTACPVPAGHQVYRWEVASGQVRSISGSCGVTGVTGTFPTISADGSTIVYVRRGNSGTGPGELWLYGHDGQQHARAIDAVNSGAPDGESFNPALSSDGRWLAFVSRATNLTARRLRSAEPQVYLRRLPDGPTLLLSATRDGDGGNGPSVLPSVDAEGLHVTFQSSASDLRCDRRVDHPCDDINMVADVILWTSDTPTTTRASGAPTGPWLDASVAPVISGNGRVLAFLTRHPVDASDGRHTLDLLLAESRP